MRQVQDCIARRDGQGEQGPSFGEGPLGWQVRCEVKVFHVWRVCEIARMEIGGYMYNAWVVWMRCGSLQQGAATEKQAEEQYQPM
jgi:hypothetical protein